MRKRREGSTPSPGTSAVTFWSRSYDRMTRVSTTSLLSRRKVGQVWAVGVRARRSPWVFALIMTPIAAVVTRSLSDQHSDNLVPAVYSVEHPFDLYLPRIIPLIQFLAFPVGDYSANLRLQVFLRVAAFCFVVTWIAVRVSQLLAGSLRAALFGAVLSSVYFFVRYPEAGDSIYYGVSAGMTATAVFLLALSAAYRLANSLTLRSRFAWSLVALLLACAAMFYYVTLVLWAGFLVVLDVAARHRSSGTLAMSATGSALRHAAVSLTVLSVAGVATVVYLRTGSGENTGVTLSRSISTVIRTRYPFDARNFYIRETLILIAFLSIGVMILAKKGVSLIVSIAGFGCGVGVFAIAALDHVAENVNLPRYYAPNLFLGLTTMICAVGVVVVQRGGDAIKSVNAISQRSEVLGVPARRRLARVCISAAVAASTFGTYIFLTSPVAFGYEGSDGQQIRKQGIPLSVDAIREVEINSDLDIRFIAGSHWQVWVTVFVAGEQGEKLFPVAPFTRAFDRASEYIPQAPVYGLCVDLDPGQCVEVAQSLVPLETPWSFSLVGPVEVEVGRRLHILRLDRA